jgi:cell division protein FtsN
MFSKLKNIRGEKTKGGLTRYVVGSFNDYKEAEAFKNDIRKTYDNTDVFIVAEFNNEYISIPEALELLK